MAGRIPQPFIDDLLDRVDIVEVVSPRVELRKSGKNYSACCPFHDEKTPSFTVSPDKQFYYCFGCGAGGNSIGFIMDYERVGFVEAVESLAKMAGLEVPREASGNEVARRKKDDLYSLMEKTSYYYRQQLRQHAEAKQAIDYLKQRGLSGEIARNFGVGYAPAGWDNLLRALGSEPQTQQQLLQAGMLIENPDKPSIYDRFRHRIMFPIRDIRGRTVAFGGRVLDDSKPKYLNSPETPIFHKGRELYGLYEAIKTLRDIPNLLVVEGYMDVVALAQFGVHNAVATLGTAATQPHLEKIFRYTTEVVFCFDGDQAGRKAATRALETTLPAMLDGRSARFLFLPEGEDPDTLVRKTGAEDFLTRVNQATHLSDFLFQTCSENLDLASLDDKARLSKLAAPLINKLPNGVFREMMFNQLSRITELDADTLKTIIAPPPPVDGQQQAESDYAGGPAGPAPDYPDYDIAARDYDGENYSSAGRAQRQPYRKQVKLPLAKMLIALLLNRPALVEQAPEAEQLAQLKALDDGEINRLCNLIELVREHPEYTLNHILGYWRGVFSQEDAAELAESAAADLMDPVADQNRAEYEFKPLFNKLLMRIRDSKPPLELLQQLAGAQALTETEVKTAKTAWAALLEGPDRELSNQLLNQILAKPRH